MRLIDVYPQMNIHNYELIDFCLIFGTELIISGKIPSSINGTYGSRKFGSVYKSCCCEQFSDQQLKKNVTSRNRG